MRVCLVSAPTIAEFRDLEPLEDELVPRFPLGVLSLASTLEGIGIHPQVVDLDTLYAKHVARRPGADFAQDVAARLAARAADVYGLSSICSSYPLTLRIATALARARPGCRVVLGGPQASASAAETLRAFPAVDAIVLGEGEPVLPGLLEALAGSRALASVPGLAYRDGRKIVRTGDGPLVEDVDALPLPAFHLYPGMRRASALPLEVGRGCPFSCTFCSTSGFFGRRFRMKSPGRILEDMRALHRRYGTRLFELVHDNFTVDAARVESFCRALLSAGVRFTWTCSSRTDTLRDDLVDLMSRAGCRGIFFGVESGSPAIQRSIRKRLDLSAARARLAHVSRRKVAATVSLIAGFPEETPADLEQTVAFFVDALRLDHVDPQLGLLSPLSGTPLEARHRRELVLDEIVSDMAFQGAEQDRSDRALIAEHPEVFSSFWSVPAPSLDRRFLDELRSFLLNARFDLRWLLVAASQAAGGGVAVFEAFRAWRAPPGEHGSARARAAYYAGPAFPRDFVRFVRRVLAPRVPAYGRALRGLARHHADVLRERRPRRRGGSRARPALRVNVRLTRIGCDGAALVAALRSGGDLSLVPRRPSTLATRVTRDRNVLVQVGEEAADLLRLCDGTRGVPAIVRAFRRVHPEVRGVPGAVAAELGLEVLRRRRLVALT